MARNAMMFMITIGGVRQTIMARQQMEHRDAVRAHHWKVRDCPRCVMMAVDVRMLNQIPAQHKSRNAMPARGNRI